MEFVNSRLLWGQGDGLVPQNPLQFHWDQCQAPILLQDQTPRRISFSRVVSFPAKQR